MAKLKDLEGLNALVTGAAGGIGLEFAKVLKSWGANLIILDISESRLLEAKSLLDSIPSSNSKSDRSPVSDSPKAKVLVMQADLTDANIVKKIDVFCHANSIIPDILINNAGIFSFKPIADTDTRKLETFVDLHVRAVTLISQWFANVRKPKGSGWMLNMSSMSCWMPMPGLAMYASTKAYIRVFSRSLHYELKDYGVGVTVACPGGIATDLFGLPKKWQKFAVAIGVLQTPEKFALNAIKRMMKKRKQYINGGLNRLSIFFVGMLPTSVRMLVKHKLLDQGIVR